MTRFAIDYLSAIRIVRESTSIHPSHSLVAPKVLHSDALAHLYRQVRAGLIEQSEARGILDGITTMRIRLLGDRVSRATAWKIATGLDWPDVGRAEYLAVANLQADFLVTEIEELASSGAVPIAAFGALSSA